MAGPAGGASAEEQPLDKGTVDMSDNPHKEHYYIDGKVYDFSDWQKIHPGGDVFFRCSFQRDISALVHAYHRNPDALKPILEKYEVELKDGVKPRDVLAKGMNVPPFILPPDFDARRDVPIYNWEKGFMKALRKRINAPELQRKIKRADLAFDVTAAVILACHILISFVCLYLDVLPAWLFVACQVVCRTSLAGVGHYHVHRAKNGKTDWGDGLFDMQYVGAASVLSDGHVMLHHVYTETPADVKRTVFTFMLTLPRLWRIPLFTAQKFGEFFSGHLIRFGTLEFKTGSPVEAQKAREQKIVRIYMLAEFFWAVLCGKASLWFVQFFFTVWINMFEIVASHDFEEVREQQEYKDLDWGIFQIQHALDTWFTGIKWVDIFLSAGLSCHRVHHVLPYQKSGFANIVCEDAVRATAKEFDVKWEPARNLVIDRFIPLAYFYLTAPAQVPAAPAPIILGGGGWGGFVKEHCYPDVLWKGLEAVGKAFQGKTI
jgi:fatty acid desaturase